MDEIVSQLAQKTGIDQATAEKVKGFLQQNAASVPNWLSGDTQQLAQTLHQKLGIDPGIAEKVVAFLKQHAAEMPKLLGDQGAGLLAKAKGMVGGMLGGKEAK